MLLIQTVVVLMETKIGCFMQEVTVQQFFFWGGGRGDSCGLYFEKYVHYLHNMLVVCWFSIVLDCIVVSSVYEIFTRRSYRYLNFCGI